METYSNARRLPYAPTDTADMYPESDGKPIAETDLHIDAIYRMRQMLKAYFAENPDVYVSGNIMMYYVKGSPQQSVSPDILVSFGIGKKQRRTYKVWEEGKPPDFVLEFSSKSTYQNDLDDKMSLYAKIGISEYFLYDAERCYLPSSLMAFRLVDGEYVEIPQRPDGGFFSETLCLTFHLLEDSFGIYDPGTEKWLQTPAEAADKRAEKADERAEKADERAEKAGERAEKAGERAEKAGERAEKAEAEIARLQEELKRLQSTPTRST